jgi:hypothetical protein
LNLQLQKETCEEIDTNKKKVKLPKSEREQASRRLFQETPKQVILNVTSTSFAPEFAYKLMKKNGYGSFANKLV